MFCFVLFVILTAGIDNKTFLAAKRYENQNEIRIDGVLEKCRDLVTLFNHSVSLKHKLTEKMTQMQLASPENFPIKYTKMRQDVKTRWNSTFSMLKSVTVCHDGIRELINSDKKLYKDNSDKILSRVELELLKEIVDVLEPFDEFTKAMSASKYATISEVLPALTRLQDILHNQVVVQSLQFVVDLLIDELKRRSEQYFKNPILITATFLDPRYKRFKFVQ